MKILSTGYIKLSPSVRNNIVHIENSHSGECRTCDYFAMCNGGCKCQYYEKGDILCRKQLFEDEMDYLMELLFVGEFDERGFFRRRIS